MSSEQYDRNAIDEAQETDSVSAESEDLASESLQSELDSNGEESEDADSVGPSSIVVESEQPDTPFCPPAKHHQARKLFGVFPQDARAFHSAQRGGSAYDYEAKYAPDPPFQGAGPNARIWRVYGDEADAFDSDLVSGWKDTLDVFLVFVGLFSAVVTSFLIQSSTALQDPTTINNYLLAELIAVQRAAASGTSVDGIAASPYAPGDPTGQPTDFWVNGLWITSLTIALSSALFAVLIKQWLQHYVSVVSGSQRDRVLARQYRFLGLWKWQVPLIIDILPNLLHLALFLFLAGLVVFFEPLHAGLSYCIIAITGATFCLYVSFNALPLFFPDCSYKTAISDTMLVVHGYLAHLRGVYSGTVVLRRLSYFISAPRERELRHIKENVDMLVYEALVWLLDFSANSSIPNIMGEAVAGIPNGLIVSTTRNVGPHTAYAIPTSSSDAFDFSRDAEVGAVFSAAGASETPFLAEATELLQEVTEFWHLQSYGYKYMNLRYDPAALKEWLVRLCQLLKSDDVRLPPSLWIGVCHAVEKAARIGDEFAPLPDELIVQLICAAGSTYEHSDPAPPRAHVWDAPALVSYREIAADLRGYVGRIIITNLRVNCGKERHRMNHTLEDSEVERLNGYIWPAVFKVFGLECPPHEVAGTYGVTYQYDRGDHAVRWHTIQPGTRTSPRPHLYELEPGRPQELFKIWEEPSKRVRDRHYGLCGRIGRHGWSARASSSQDHGNVESRLDEN